MVLKGMENAGRDPEAEFKSFWENKAKKWQEEMRQAKFSESLESKLLLFIENEFIDSYVLAKGRDTRNLQIFINSCFNAMEDDPMGQPREKVIIFNMIKEDLALLITMNRN